MLGTTGVLGCCNMYYRNRNRLRLFPFHHVKSISVDCVKTLRYLTMSNASYHNQDVPMGGAGAPSTHNHSSATLQGDHRDTTVRCRVSSLCNKSSIMAKRRDPEC